MSTDSTARKWYVTKKMIDGGYCVIGAPCDSEVAALTCKKHLGNGDDLEIHRVLVSNPTEHSPVTARSGAYV